MSEFSFSRTIITTKILILFDNFFSFIVSHPLYFLYFIFFSPYLIKILSFLSPLFVTTSLLLISLFAGAFSPPTFVRSDTRSNGCSYHKYAGRRQQCEVVVDENEDSLCFEELEVYKIVFQTTSMHGFSEDKVEESCVTRAACVDKIMLRTSSCGFNGEDPVEKACVASIGSEAFVDKIVLSTSVRALGEDPDEKMCLASRKTSGGSDEKCIKERVASSRSIRFEKTHSTEDYSPANNVAKYEKIGSNFGSMWDKMEWRKTLACKLFEERHDVDEGGEGMDSLWETHEIDSDKVLSKRETKKTITRSSRLDYNYDDDDIVNGDLCCLQALKFSSGKMNLGMKRPSLVKISKALKGINWFHHVGKKGKKVNT